MGCNRVSRKILGIEFLGLAAILLLAAPGAAQPTYFIDVSYAPPQEFSQTPTALYLSCNVFEQTGSASASASISFQVAYPGVYAVIPSGPQRATSQEVNTDSDTESFTGLLGVRGAALLRRKRMAPKVAII